MKACFALMYYLMTWLRPVRIGVWIGAAALLVALAVGLVFGLKLPAFGIAIYAGFALLLLPYVFAWHAFRTMLGSRRLSSLPGFRLRLGLAMLLLTLLAALYLPLMSMLFWPGVVPLHVSLALFLGASLFTFVLQWAVASRCAVVVYSLGPFVLIYVIGKLWPVLFIVFYRVENAPALSAIALLGWGLALYTITSRRDFRPPSKTPMHPRDYVWEGRADLLGVLLGNYKGPVKSAEGTLLAGAPDGFSGRFMAMLTLVVISPLTGLLALYVTGISVTPNAEPGAYAGTFLLFSMMTGIFAALGSGELAPRGRLLWLRLAGGRRNHWRHLERRVLADAGILALLVISVAGATSMLFDSPTFDPLAYCALTLAGHLLSNYFSLAARISQWSILLQLLASAGMIAGLIVGFLANILTAPVTAALMLGLALLFREQALRRFAAVDWQRLRPAFQARKEKLA